MMEDQLEAFVASSEIEVPEDLVEEAVERMTTEIFHQKRYEYMAEGKIFAPEDIEQFTAEILDIARTEIKTRLVLEDIIKNQAFEVTEAELEEEVKALAKREELSVEAIKGFLGEDMASLKDDILIGKAIDFITS